MTYEELLLEAEKDDLTVTEKPFRSNAKGLCKGKKIHINSSIKRNVEKVCVLAEEMGHYHTTAGDIINQDAVDSLKQERRARAWAYNKIIPSTALKDAYEKGYHEPYEAAEYLNVSEKFLKDSLEYYHEKHGQAFIDWLRGKKVLLLTRQTEKLSKEDRQILEKLIENSIDIYFEKRKQFK